VSYTKENSSAIVSSKSYSMKRKSALIQKNRSNSRAKIMYYIVSCKSVKITPVVSGEFTGNEQPYISH